MSRMVGSCGHTRLVPRPCFSTLIGYWRTCACSARDTCYSSTLRGGRYDSTDCPKSRSVRDKGKGLRLRISTAMQRKRPRSVKNVAFIYAGNDLLSHTLSRAVQSALRGLTSVFGMGTGGSPAV